MVELHVAHVELATQELGKKLWELAQYLSKYNKQGVPAEGE